MQWIRSREFVIVVCLSLTASLVSLFQTWVYLFQVPTGFTYTLLHNYEQDYYWYLSLMRQGWDGSLLLTSKYSPEVFAPQFVNTFFSVLGMKARALGLSLPLIYTAARAIGGLLLLVAGFGLLRGLREPRAQQFIAFLLMVFGAPFWFIEHGTLKQAGEFWTGFDPIFRITWLPHHTIANALAIVSSILFLGLIIPGDFHGRAKDFGWGILSCLVVGILAASALWVNPGSAIVIAAAVIVAVGLLLWFPRSLIKVCLYVLPIAASVLLLLRAQQSVFPWTAFRDWEKFQQYPIDAMGYLGTLGITGVLAFFGIPVALKKREALWNFVTLWFLLPFVGLAAVSYVPISNGRFLQSAGYIAAAILASEALFSLRVYLSHPGGGIGRHVGVRGVRFVVVVVIVLFSLFSLPSFMASIDRQLRYIEKNQNNQLVYVPSDWISAMDSLSQKNATGVILAPETVSTMLPAFTSLRTLLGHPTFTYQIAQKQHDLSLIYSAHETNVREILEKYTVEYVWVERGGVADTLRKFERLGFATLLEQGSVIVLKRL